MNATAYRPSCPSELERVVEPLVSYICATDKPNTALFSVLALLYRQIDATNGDATAHYRRFAASR